MWLVASLLGTVALLSGLLSFEDALAITERVAPVLVFLVAVTVLSELSDAAQLFDVAASRAAQAARGRTLGLFALVVVMASVTTVVLSLDTTAVLLTPVVLATAQQLDLPPLPFALVTVWLANTASLLLPVSNLTNLLAVDRLDLSTSAFAGRTAVPTVVAVLVTTVFLLVWRRRELLGRYAVPVGVRPDDPLLCVGAGVACLLLVAGLVLGAPVAVAATTAAAVLTALCLWRKRSALRWSLVPWRLVLLVEGLFLVVQALGPLGVDDLLREGIGAPLQTAFVAAGGANLVNNLPAYLAVERVVPKDQLLALLVGVNLGPLVLPWGSLATLLWAERCRARGVQISWLTYGAAGMLLVPILLLAVTPLV